MQQLTCNIGLSNSFYYPFFSFVLIELKPFVFKGRVLGKNSENVRKSAKNYETILPFSCCPLVFPRLVPSGAFRALDFNPPQRALSNGAATLHRELLKAQRKGPRGTSPQNVCSAWMKAAGREGLRKPHSGLSGPKSRYSSNVMFALGAIIQMAAAATCYSNLSPIRSHVASHSCNCKNSSFHVVPGKRNNRELSKKQCRSMIRPTGMESMAPGPPEVQSREPLAHKVVICSLCFGTANVAWNRSALSIWDTRGWWAHFLAPVRVSFPIGVYQDICAPQADMQQKKATIINANCSPGNFLRLQVLDFSGFSRFCRQRWGRILQKFGLCDFKALAFCQCHRPPHVPTASQEADESNARQHYHWRPNSYIPFFPDSQGQRHTSLCV